MTAVEWDAATSSLRLHRDALAVLGACAGSTRAPLLAHEAAQDHLQALRDAGVLDGLTVTPALQPVAAAIASHRLRLALRRQDAGGRRTVDGWVSPEAAVLFVVGDEDSPRGDVVAVPPTHLAGTLAPLVGLGPRPRPGVETLELPVHRLDSLLAAGEPSDRDRLAGWLPDESEAEQVDALLAAATTLRWRWQLTAQWASPGHRTLLDVLDTGAGLWQVVVEDATARLHATTPTDVWRALAGLVLEPAAPGPLG